MHGHARDERLQNGSIFKSARAARKHAFDEYYTFKEKQDAVKVWKKGDVIGHPILLKSLERCRVWILDHSEQIILEDCVETQIVAVSSCFMFYIVGIESS